jgi:hypothetical protein
MAQTADVTSAPDSCREIPMQQVMAGLEASLLIRQALLVTSRDRSREVASASFGRNAPFRPVARNLL